MKEQVGTIDLKPTPEGYADQLILILAECATAEDKKCAREEIRKAFKTVARRNPDAWGGEAPTPAPDTEIVTAEGLGTIEKVGSLNVPDLWGVAMLFSDAAAIAKKAEDYYEEHHLDDDYNPINERAKIAIPSSVEAERISKDILRTWHLAHSLQDHIIAH